MKIYSVLDPEFKAYGRVIEGYDLTSLLDTLSKIPCPAGVDYFASYAPLEAEAVTAQFRDNLYGGMPIQMGCCNGHNTLLNCLEYHRDSEMSVSPDDFIYLIAKQEEIVDDMLDTSKVKAFLCPKGTLVEIFATTLHYAPCSAKKGDGFRVLVVLPKDTNTEAPNRAPITHEDTLLTARNKWLLAHPDSSEAKGGAVVGLSGVNIDIADLI